MLETTRIEASCDKYGRVVDDDEASGGELLGERGEFLEGRAEFVADLAQLDSVHDGPVVATRYDEAQRGVEVVGPVGPAGDGIGSVLSDSSLEHVRCHLPSVQGIPEVLPLVLLRIVLVALCHVDVAVAKEGPPV